MAIAAPGRKPLTYGGLCRLVEETVEYLNSIGVRRGDCLAAVLPDGPEAAVAFLGIAAGAACAPLNPRYRASEFALFLSALGAKALITASDSIKTKMRSDAHQSAWSKLFVGGLELYEVPGDHLDAVEEPYVRFWAGKLKASLRSAQERAGHARESLGEARLVGTEIA